MGAGYDLHLANPCAIQQYNGLKYTDDQYDAFWLAHLLALGIVPEGYIYPCRVRSIRDLLRKRIYLVRHRPSHIQSLQSMIEHYNGQHISANEIKKVE